GAAHPHRSVTSKLGFGLPRWERPIRRVFSTPKKRPRRGTSPLERVGFSHEQKFIIERRRGKQRAPRQSPARHAAADARRRDRDGGRRRCCPALRRSEKGGSKRDGKSRALHPASGSGSFALTSAQPIRVVETAMSSR